MAKDKAKKAASDPEAKASGRKRKKAEDPPAKDETEEEAEPAGDPVADADPADEPVEAKRRKGSDAKEAAEPARDDPSDVAEPAPGEAATPEREKKKKGRTPAKPKSGERGAKAPADAPDAPIVKVPSSKERLGELKTALEEGMKELEEGRALVAAGEAELAALEAKMFEARNRISQQEARDNRASRRLKQTAKALREQAVNTDMLKATLVTLVVRKAAKSKEPMLQEVAATCGAILADWKAVVAQDPGAADALLKTGAAPPAETRPPETAAAAARDPETRDPELVAKELVTKELVTKEETETEKEKEKERVSVPAIVPGKTAPHDPTRARVVGWLCARVSPAAARALELEIFQAAATCGDEYKRCFKAAADLVARGNVPEGFVRKVVAGWEP